MPRKKIKVLVVDDSILFRKTLAMGIATDPAIQVVGTAADPYEARDMIFDLEPDVMTLDINMPRMNGIDFLKKLMGQHPMPVVVISSVDGAVFDALRAGAVDFVAKPNYKDSKGFEPLVRDIIEKIKIAASAKVGQGAFGVPLDQQPGVRANSQYSAIAIGASTGGTEAIFNILKKLPKGLPPILIVQHMPAVFTKLYAERLNGSCATEVKEAENMDMVKAGTALIAPGNYHMRLKRVNNELRVECFTGEKINGHCPSVDVLFESVAKVLGRKALGVILTGMGTDGAKGLLTMRKMGAKTIGQNERTSVVYGMPKAAYDIGAVTHEVGIDDIANLLYAWTIAR